MSIVNGILLAMALWALLCAVVLVWFGKARLD
jgi:hypothetical protein